MTDPVCDCAQSFLTWHNPLRVDPSWELWWLQHSCPNISSPLTSTCREINVPTLFFISAGAACKRKLCSSLRGARRPWPVTRDLLKRWLRWFSSDMNIFCTFLHSAAPQLSPDSPDAVFEAEGSLPLVCDGQILLYVTFLRSAQQRVHCTPTKPNQDSSSMQSPISHTETSSVTTALSADTAGYNLKYKIQLIKHQTLVDLCEMKMRFLMNTFVSRFRGCEGREAWHVKRFARFWFTGLEGLLRPWMSQSLMEVQEPTVSVIF